MLFDQLSNYNKRGIVPFHMPGHKRNTALLGEGLPYHIDITEISGFDNLQSPTGVLKETSEFAARLYGARRAFPLVSGSTGGILAAIHSVVRRGDKVIMARNCHKSVYNAVELFELRPVYLVPETDEAPGIAGSVWPGQVRAAIARNADAKLIIVTSPTYEGVVTDIAAICDVAHQYGIPVMVDAAHGAHLGFSNEFPRSPLACGADLVVTSLHKTLPALTQCALALVGGELVDEERLSVSVTMFQTSSPSYVLLSSIDKCLRLLDEEGEQLFEDYTEQLKSFSQRVSGLKKLHVLCRSEADLSRYSGFYGFDPGKLVIDTSGTNMSGVALMSRLRDDYQIELEMAGAGYAVAMTSFADTKASFDRLSDALLDIDQSESLLYRARPRGIPFTLPKQLKSTAAALGMKGELVSPDNAMGLMSLEYVWVYPPGIPFLVPGEMIGDDIVRLITRYTEEKLTVNSSSGRLPSFIRCANVP